MIKESLPSSDCGVVSPHLQFVAIVCETNTLQYYLFLDGILMEEFPSSRIFVRTVVTVAKYSRRHIEALTHIRDLSKDTCASQKPVKISDCGEGVESTINFNLFETTKTKSMGQFRNSKPQHQKSINYLEHVKCRRNLHEPGKMAKLSVLEDTEASLS